MTITQLKSLKERKFKAWKLYKKLTVQLDENCTHPKRYMRTKMGYDTDTLGNNGTCDYTDICTLCGAHLDNYGGVYSGYDGYEKYPLLKEKE